MCERWVGGKQHLKKKFKDLLLLYKPAATAGLVFVLALWVCVCVIMTKCGPGDPNAAETITEEVLYVCLSVDR